MTRVLVPMGGAEVGSILTLNVIGRSDGKLVCEVQEVSAAAGIDEITGSDGIAITNGMGPIADVSGDALYPRDGSREALDFHATSSGPADVVQLRLRDSANQEQNAVGFDPVTNKSYHGTLNQNFFIRSAFSEYRMPQDANSQGAVMCVATTPNQLDCISDFTKNGPYAFPGPGTWIGVQSPAGTDGRGYHLIEGGNIVGWFRQYSSGQVELVATSDPLSISGAGLSLISSAAWSASGGGMFAQCDGANNQLAFQSPGKNSIYGRTGGAVRGAVSDFQINGYLFPSQISQAQAPLLRMPIADGLAGQVMTTNGAGQLSLTAGTPGPAGPAGPAGVGATGYTFVVSDKASLVAASASIGAGVITLNPGSYLIVGTIDLTVTAGIPGSTFNDRIQMVSASSLTGGGDPKQYTISGNNAASIINSVGGCEVIGLQIAQLGAGVCVDMANTGGTALLDTCLVTAGPDTVFLRNAGIKVIQFCEFNSSSDSVETVGATAIENVVLRFNSYNGGQTALNIAAGTTVTRLRYESNFTLVSLGTSGITIAGTLSYAEIQDNTLQTGGTCINRTGVFTGGRITNNTLIAGSQNSAFAGISPTQPGAAPVATALVLRNNLWRNVAGTSFFILRESGINTAFNPPA